MTFLEDDMIDGDLGEAICRAEGWGTRARSVGGVK
jgi:hypothetical protein